ncbi:MAG: hypothetical protein NZ519_06425 [Bacteroidia bacterium]|nr:hypothetical protein [Bacteroidia bacterium]
MDILINSNSELRIENGDFVLGNANEQNLHLLMLTGAGHWKHAPTTGIMVSRMLLDEQSFPYIRLAIKKGLENDGATVKKISINSSGVVAIDAQWE